MIARAPRLVKHKSSSPPQFVSLVRGDIQLRYLLRFEADADHRRGIDAAVEDAVATFLRAFESPSADQP
jgi:hypothetical protein